MNQKGLTCYTDLNTGKLADHQKSGSPLGASLAGKAVSVLTVQVTNGIYASATEPHRPGSTIKCRVTASEANPIFSPPHELENFFVSCYSVK